MPTGPQPTPPLSRLHLWQIQWVRDLMLLAAIFGVVYLGYQIRLVTVPMLLAIAFAYLFEPLIRWLGRKKICSRRTAAIGIIVLSFVVIIVPASLAASFAVVQGARAATDLADNVSRVQKSIASPDDPALQQAVPPGAWTSIRDFLVKRNTHPASTPPAPVDPTSPAPPAPPGAEPSPSAPASQGAAGGLLARVVDRELFRELGQRAVEWLNDHAGELSSALGKRVATGGAAAAGAALATAAAVAAIVFQALLTALFFYFFSTGWGRVLEFSESFIPERNRPRVLDVLAMMDRAIAGFVRGRITICAIEACFFTLMYFLAGIPGAFIMGPLLGVLFIVPFMQVLGIPVAILLMWLNNVHGPVFAPHMFDSSGGIWYILIVPVVIHLGANWFDDYFLTPTIQGKHTDLAIPIIIFASIAGGALAGVYGLLLAIPVAACVRILAREVFWPRVQAWVRGEAKDVLPIGKE